ncbi:hypothetical protein [Streptomyces sp. AP-93]|uniref:hypothetical protein n=1 Tax=Streptomyces sp. AP-93 TaxID=2929048 RepID=UPI001FAE7F7F|nr:hypothetical protein [Streptomyces sp. AP-93]MCJ0874761.1 hypothetical protein [Streptomyces sp. AP-93]
MTLTPKRRPGRKLAEDPARMAYGSPEANELIARIHQIVNNSGGALAEAAQRRGMQRQTLDRLLHKAQPDWHVVELVVTYCIEETGGQDRHGWLKEVNGLWEKSRTTAPGTGAATALPAPDPDPGPLPGPGPLVPLLGLVLEGRYELVAEHLADAGPVDASGVGEVLKEIGNRSPGAAAAVIQAAVAQGRRDMADTWMQALEDCAEDVAAAVRRHLPPDVPDVVDPPEPAVPAVSIADLDPTAFEGKRLALLVRRGDVAQAATDILVRATPDPENDSARTDILSGMSLGHDGVHIPNAADGVLALRQGDAEDLHTLAAVLGSLVLRGHAELAAVVLRRLGEDDTALATDILQAVPRPQALAVLRASTTVGFMTIGFGATEALLARAPAPVAADFLLAAARDGQGAKEPADLLMELPHRTEVLHCMAVGDHQQTARVLNVVAVDWSLTGHNTPERRITASFLHVAGADSTVAARVLLQFLRFNSRSAADLLYLMETTSAQGDATQVTARALTGTLDLAPSVAATLIARMARREDFPIRLLEQVSVDNPTHGTLLATHMMAQDLAYFRSQIPSMIRQQATTLAAELLQQLAGQEPEAPWTLIRQALTAGATEAALANADAYIATR